MYTTASGLEMLSDSYFFGTRTGGTRMLLDSSGNLGLGVTPSAWSSGGNITLADNKAIGAAGQYLNLSANWYYSGGDKYVGNGYATLYYQQAGAHKWYIAPNNTSGAGATLPWQLMKYCDLTVAATPLHEFVCKTKEQLLVGLVVI